MTEIEMLRYMIVILITFLLTSLYYTIIDKDIEIQEYIIKVENKKYILYNNYNRKIYTSKYVIDVFVFFNKYKTMIIGSYKLYYIDNGKKIFITNN